MTGLQLKVTDAVGDDTCLLYSLWCKLCRNWWVCVAGAVQQQLLGLSVTPGSASSVVATAKGSAPVHQVQVMRPKQVQLRPTIQVSVSFHLVREFVAQIVWALAWRNMNAFSSSLNKFLPCLQCSNYRGAEGAWPLFSVAPPLDSEVKGHGFDPFVFFCVVSVIGPFLCA